MNRREFLKNSSLVAGALVAHQLGLETLALAQRRGDMLYRMSII